jgi:hypothetical protein
MIRECRILQTTLRREPIQVEKENDTSCSSPVLLLLPIKHAVAACMLNMMHANEIGLASDSTVDFVCKHHDTMDETTIDRVPIQRMLWHKDLSSGS